MCLTWSDELATGIRKIDLQHQELIEMINELCAALKSNEDVDTLKRLLPRLSAYVLFHFGTEEAMFRNDPACAEHAEVHVREHQAFSMKIASFKDAAPDEQGAAMAELVDYLQHWLVEHIMKTDQELARLLNGRGDRQFA